MSSWRRFAVYYAPRPETELARFGAAWLGRDAERGAEVAGLEAVGLPRPRAEITARPRRYGFHATLKAPFRLAEGREAGELDAAVRELAAGLRAFDLPLALSAEGAFLALTPRRPCAAVAAVAAACVTGLEGFRAPLTLEETRRREAAGLSAEEAAHLARWGYPYVLDAFSFHMTLTGPLAPENCAATKTALGAALGPLLAAPAAFADLCVFGEGADGDFRVLARHPLAGS